MIPAPRYRALLAALACMTAGAAAAAEPSALELDAAAQHRLGVAVSPLAAATRSARADGLARVLDAGPLAVLDADIAAASAAASASRAEADRTRALHAADAAMSAKAMEAAAAQARADAAKLTLLRRRLDLEWGPAIGRLSDARRGALIGDLAAGRAALVRIDSARGEGQGASGPVEIDLGPLGRATAVVLGPARAAEARLQSPGVIGKVTGPQASRLAAGLTAPARLSGGKAAGGVMLPRGALLRAEGTVFVYVRTAPTRFERRVVEGGTPDPAGLFVTSGFRPGEAVAVSGGAALLTAEHKAADKAAEKGAD
ncbi:MAG: hypothetical protein IIZ63_01560 [Caulobacteraceae bacterium]|nr:hypothetical protein [Caulobacteraceae bacterium]